MSYGLCRHSTNLIVDTLFILLTTLNSLGKQVAFNLRARRIDKLIDIINGPVFEATKPYHVEVLKENALVMSQLLTLYHVAIFTCGTMWTVFPIVNRALGEEVQFTGYFPFETSSTIT
uniref:Odorant receptor n=2 Tax=Heliothis virescens TaxID=7102 RepID=A0A2A4J260_HELVI